jgi:DNA modification methylase
MRTPTSWLKKMNVVQVSVDSLTPAKYNPRKIQPQDFAQIKRSLEEFGFVQPLVVNKATGREGIIIGGHQRFQAAKEIGMKEVPVYYVDIPEEEKEKELNIRLNRNQGEFDNEILKTFQEDMLLDIGFKPVELDDIYGAREVSDIEEDEIPEEPEIPRAKPGYIYTLGNHRLMCGDSTSPHDVRALIGEDQVDMVFTDPPYNVNYAGKGKHTSNVIANDDLSESDFDLFIYKVFENMHAVMKDGAVFYVCSGWSSYPVFNFNLIKNGFYRAGVIIWVKNQAPLGWQDYRYKHEWILVGKKKPARVKAVSILYGWKKGSHFFRDTRDEYDVWEVPKKKTKEYRHPTEKPVWLVEKAIANSTQRGALVADFFGGGGSTLVACERLSRKGYALEFDPKYVDVIIKRMCRITKQNEDEVYSQAVRVDGRSETESGDK